MQVLNYAFTAKLAALGRHAGATTKYRVHKQAPSARCPRVSIILLDWACREKLHSLDWLERQDVPRHEYELIWIDLYDRVLPEALEHADTVVTLNQTGMYHKHVGYNVGLLLARGEIINICDSDAVFPEDFVRSIDMSFHNAATGRRRSLVLMHQELRTCQTYPESLNDASELKDRERWQWWDIVPNVGACMSVLRDDAIAFGGFDECPSYRGYLCGPYDLGWRMVNAGIPETWHDLSTVIWHFAHPNPSGSNGFVPSVRRLLEITYPHVDMHALTAVDHFSAGRVLPNRENAEIHAMRMARRQIGTEFESKYADLTGPGGFRRWQVSLLRLVLVMDLILTVVRRWTSPLWGRLVQSPAGGLIRRCRRLARVGLEAVGIRLNRPYQPGRRVPQLVFEGFHGHNIVYFQGSFFGLHQDEGAFDSGQASSASNCPYLRGPSIRAVKRQIRQALPQARNPHGR